MDQFRGAGITGEVVRAGANVVHLRRTFATRGDALAFATPFVVNVADADGDRATVRFADCDQVAEVGQDPEGRRQAVFSYSLDFEGHLDGGGAYAGLDCRASTRLPTPEEWFTENCPLAGRTLIYRLPIPGPVVPTTLWVDGADAPPASISPIIGGVFFEIDLEAALDEPIMSAAHELAIEQDGTRSSTFVASFEPCTHVATEMGVDPATLLYQRQGLKLVDGVLQVDGWAGIECGTITGEAFAEVP